MDCIQCNSLVLQREYQYRGKTGQHAEGLKLIHLQSDQTYIICMVAKCCHSKGVWKPTWGFTGVLFCSCQGFFFLPEEIHYICLNEFCKLAISLFRWLMLLSVCSAVEALALTWNTVFTWFWLLSYYIYYILQIAVIIQQVLTIHKTSAFVIICNCRLMGIKGICIDINIV